MPQTLKLPAALVQILGLQPTPAVVDTPHYQGFVQEAAQTLQVWGLLDAGGWISLTLEDGASCLPVWSQPHDARAFACGPWAKCKPGPIDLPDFLDHWLPAMDSLGVLVSVQPEEASRLLPVPARVLAWHLQVRCIHFPAQGLGDEPGPMTLSPTGEP
jgi:hypothetical protein